MPWGRIKVRLDEATGVEDWRLHDIRRTVATNLGRWVGFETVASVLNHSRTSLMGVTATYNLYEYEKEKRRALDRWASELQRLITSDDSNIVHIHPSASDQSTLRD